MNIQETKDAARGQWRGILVNMGVGESHLHKKKGPCPLCGGKDRFQFDNKDGAGTWYCQQCGAGDGFSLAQKVTGKDFITIVREVGVMLGAHKFDADPVPKERTKEDILEANRRVWRGTVKMEVGNIVDVYLRGRGVGQEAYVADLRCGLSIWDGDGGTRPCMVAMIRDPEGGFASLHRTFLAKDGKGKADMASPRKMMPGSISVGSCVRLMEWREGAVLGIAEGIETAFAASKRFKVPVWAALNANMLENWQWPSGCNEIIIFADSDASYVGQAAAFNLAKRARAKGINVCVSAPGMGIDTSFLGSDWQDMVGV